MATGDSIAATLGIIRNSSRCFCNYWHGMAQEAAFGWSLLSARGLVGDEVDVEKYIHDALVDLLCHEVGHTLGLRHNFKASTIHTTEQLQDKKLTAEEGLTGSIMDYNPVNIAPEGQKQGEYFHSTLGLYDYWAIEYAYRPIDAASPESETAVLEKIASRVADPKLIYGTDEDAFGGARGIDPTCNRFDLGADPINYHRTRIELAQELWSKMEKQFENIFEK